MPPSKETPAEKKKATTRKKSAAKKTTTRKKSTTKKSTTTKRKSTAKPKKKKETPPVESASTKSAVLADLDKIVEAEDLATPDRDYGVEVEDILGDLGVSEPEEKKEEDKQKEPLSVESILQGDVMLDEDMQVSDTEPAITAKPKNKKKKAKRKMRWGALVPIFIFVLAILLVAEGAGLFGGSGQKKLAEYWGSVTALFGSGKSGEQVQPVETGPLAPAMVSVNFLLSQQEESAELSVPAIMSQLIETDIQVKDSFTATGEAESDDAVSVGTLLVINESTTDYQFVASTRFLSEDGVLFRLKEASAIPAESTVEVQVYADVAGPTGDIGPSQFTIPGLGPELEETVYGRSRSSMTGGDGMVAAVSSEDIEQARQDLMDRLLNEAKTNFESMLAAEEIILDDLITSNELEATYPEVDAVGSSFEVEMSVRFSSLTIPTAKVRELLQSKFAEELPEDLDSADYAFGDLLYTVEAYDTTSNRAEIRVEAPVMAN